MYNIRILLIIVLIWLYYIPLLQSICPNLCNGHGYCNSNNLCDCISPWDASPDCNQMTCPFDFAWSGKYANGTAHRMVECSNAGLCNRNTGTCDCFDGFEGIACQKQTCNCVYGRCVTLEYLYESNTKITNITDYLLWESNHTTSCICDWGYTGAACDMAMCAKGYDPLTPIYDYPAIQLSITTSLAYAPLTGEIDFSFNGFSVSLPSDNRELGSDLCETLIESLPNIDDVLCYKTELMDMDYVYANYTIVFLQFHSIPMYENNIYFNDGNPLLSAFQCNADTVSYIGWKHTYLDIVSCKIQQISSSSSVPSFTYCSSRGICDFTIGKCLCYDGFAHSNCDTYIYNNNSIAAASDYDILTIVNNNLSFNSSILHLTSIYPSTPQNNYNMFYVSDITRNKFIKIGSNGNLYLNAGGINIEGNLGLGYGHGGMVVGSGGMVVSSDGVSVNSKGIYIKDGMTISSGGVIVNNLNILQGGLSISSGGLHSAAFETNIYDGVDVVNGGFYLSNGLTISSGGLIVESSGVSIYSGGLVVSAGMTMGSSTGLPVSGVTINSGLVIGNNINIYSKGLYIQDPNFGLSTYGSAGLLIESGGITIAPLGLVITGGLSVNTNIPQEITGVVNINSNGLFIKNGISIESGGLSVQSSGIITTNTSSNEYGFQTTNVYVIGGTSINQGNLVVNAPISTSLGPVTSQGLFGSLMPLQISQGMTIIGPSSRLQVDNGMSVSGGLYLNAAGFSITSGSLAITGGLSVNNLACGGIIVNNGPFYVLNSLSVGGNGLYSQGGLTVNSRGLVITGGSTIASNGLAINYNSLSVSSGSVYISSGLTIGSDSLVVNNGGMTISGDLYVGSGGLTIGGNTNLPALTVAINSVGLALIPYSGFSRVTIGALAISSSSNIMSIANNGFNALSGITATSANVAVSSGSMSIMGTGAIVNQLSIGSSGMVVTGGMTVVNSKLVVSTTQGITVNSNVFIGNNLVVNNHVYLKSGSYACPMTNCYFVVRQGITIGSSAYVSGSLALTNGLYVNSGALSIPLGGVSVDGGMTIIGNLWYYSPNTQLVINNGLSTKGGLTVANSNCQVLSGGLTVASNGLTVPNAISVRTLGLNIGNIAGYSNGLVIGGGGLNVNAGGLTIFSSGLSFDGGVRMTGGLAMSNGMTVQGIVSVTGGMIINSALTATSNVNGGLTIADTGLTVSNGVNVKGTAGLQITGGLSVQWKGLYINNALTVNGNTWLDTYTTTSDMRLKSNIVQLDSLESLDKVKRLRGVYYNWKQSENFDSNDKQVGVIAQEVLAVLPEAVRYLKDSYLSVNYQSLLPLLIESIHELEKHVSEVEKISLTDNQDEDIMKLLSTLERKLLTYQLSVSQLENFE